MQHRLTVSKGDLILCCAKFLFSTTQRNIKMNDSRFDYHSPLRQLFWIRQRRDGGHLKIGTFVILPMNLITIKIQHPTPLLNTLTQFCSLARMCSSMSATEIPPPDICFIRLTARARVINTHLCYDS